MPPETRPSKSSRMASLLRDGLLPPENEDERDVGGEESVSEALSKQIFAPYQCRYWS